MVMSELDGIVSSLEKQTVKDSSLGNDSPNISRLREFLNKKLRVTIEDGRVFIGVFYCVDHSKNFVLGETEEYQTRILKTKLHSGKISFS